jgi:glycosyltransferase involved in cell wall biosynthesis
VRLALFSPWPPVRSGIADYARDLAAGLVNRHEIDIYVRSPEERTGDGPERVQRLDAHDFPWRHARAPYDLVIYQLGNSAWHDYMWPYLFRYPGLIVLHDGALHHARAAALLRRKRADDYRAELAFSHPGLPREAAELAINAFDGPLYYDWPMLRAVVTSARGVAVHSARLADQLSAEFPGVRVDYLAMGIPAPDSNAADAAAVRARHGLPADAFVIGAFGGVTPEKRIGPLLEAASVVRRYHPSLRILLVGSEHSHFDVTAEATAAGVADLLTVTGYVDEGELPAYLGAVDVVSSLRFPGAGETSASWLRALAAGRPTIVTDLAQLADVPTIDPRSRTVVHARPTRGPHAPVAVSIDILDEVHSLVLALKALAADASLRQRLGANARDYWRAHHTVARMIEDYERAIARGAAAPAPAVTLPAHLRSDGFEHARDLATGAGFRLPDGWQ